MWAKRLLPMSLVFRLCYVLLVSITGKQLLPSSWNLHNRCTTDYYWLMDRVTASATRSEARLVGLVNGTFRTKKTTSCHAKIKSLLKIFISDWKLKICRLGVLVLKCERAQKLWQDDHDEDEQLKMKTVKQSVWTVLFKALTDPHAPGLCGDVLFNTGITGHSLASQLLGKVVQTN